MTDHVYDQRPLDLEALGAMLDRWHGKLVAVTIVYEPSHLGAEDAPPFMWAHGRLGERTDAFLGDSIVGFGYSVGDGVVATGYSPSPSVFYLSPRTFVAGWQLLGLPNTVEAVAADLGNGLHLQVDVPSPDLG